MKYLVAMGLALTLAVAPATGQHRARRPEAVVRPAHQPSTLQLLSQRLEDVSFQEAPLDQVIDWIDGLSALNFVVRWSVLEDAGIERDIPISLHAHNLRLSQVLWLIINEAGGSDVKLAYQARGELLIVSTEQDLESEMVLVVYDIGDLLARIPRFNDGPRIDFASSRGSGAAGGQTVVAGTPGDDGTEGTGNQDHSSDATRLIALLVDTVEPDSWVKNGGFGTIYAFRQQLVVRNSILVHQTLGGYLAGD